jgi:hypothetical protein
MGEVGRVEGRLSGSCRGCCAAGRAVRGCRVNWRRAASSSLSSSTFSSLFSSLAVSRASAGSTQGDEHHYRARPCALLVYPHRRSGLSLPLCFFLSHAAFGRARAGLLLRPRSLLDALSVAHRRSSCLTPFPSLFSSSRFAFVVPLPTTFNRSCTYNDRR